MKEKQKKYGKEKIWDSKAKMILKKTCYKSLETETER